MKIDQKVRSFRPVWFYKRNWIVESTHFLFSEFSNCYFLSLSQLVLSYWCSKWCKLPSFQSLRKHIVIYRVFFEACLWLNGSDFTRTEVWNMCILTDKSPATFRKNDYYSFFTRRNKWSENVVEIRHYVAVAGAGVMYVHEFLITMVTGKFSGKP